jgi:hypothetical protein
LLQGGWNGCDSNLQLALALSASMQEAEDREQLQEEDCLLEAGLGHEVVEQQKHILERFGFRSSRPAVLAPSSSRHRSGKLILFSTLLKPISTYMSALLFSHVLSLHDLDIMQVLGKAVFMTWIFVRCNFMSCYFEDQTERPFNL